MTMLRSTRLKVRKRWSTASNMWTSAIFMVAISGVLIIPTTIAMFHGLVSPSVIMAMGVTILCTAVSVAFINQDIHEFIHVHERGVGQVLEKDDPSLLDEVFSIVVYFGNMVKLIAIGMLIYTVCANAAILWSVFEGSMNPLFDRDLVETIVVSASVMTTIPLGIAPALLAWRKLSSSWARSTFKKEKIA